MFMTLDKFGLFRVDAKAEAAGLDIIKHNEKAYDYGENRTEKKLKTGNGN